MGTMSVCPSHTGWAARCVPPPTLRTSTGDPLPPAYSWYVHRGWWIYFWNTAAIPFLAHLSTMCSWWAIVTGLCPSCVVVRRASSVNFLAHLSTKCSVSFCDPSMSGVRHPCVRAFVRPSTISLNYISSETAYWILTKLHRNDPWVVPY